MTLFLNKQVYIYCFLLVLLSCKPKKSPEPLPEPIPVPESQSPFVCKELPPAPVPFGWNDSTTNVDENVNTLMYNPANPDEAIIVVNGNILGYNKLICYNVRSGKKIHLANLGPHIPRVNQKGWLVYSTVDNNIFKVKCNGDSLKQLTSGNTTRDPKWDYTGNNVYIYQSSYANIPSQIMRFKPDGSVINNMELDLPNTAVFNNSDKIIYQKVKDNSVTLVLRNMQTQVETMLITGPYTQGVEHFNNLCLDNKDENLYWSNAGGIFRCSLASLKTETLFANCTTVKYSNPVFQKNRPNELFIACQFIKQLSNFDLLYQFKGVELNLITNEKKVIELFPQ